MMIEDEFYIKLKQKLIDNAPSAEEYAQFTKEERDRYQLGLARSHLVIGIALSNSSDFKEQTCIY